MIKNLITATLIATAPLMTFDGGVNPYWLDQENDVAESLSFYTSHTTTPEQGVQYTYEYWMKPYLMENFGSSNEYYTLDGRAWEIRERLTIDTGPNGHITRLNHYSLYIVLKYYNEASVNGIRYRQKILYESPNELSYWQGEITQQDYSAWYNFNEDIFLVNYQIPNQFGNLPETETENDDNFWAEYTTGIGFGSTYYYGLRVEGSDVIELSPEQFYLFRNVVEYDIEVIDVGGLMWEILGMPFAFISTAFNLTIFPNTPYAINIANILFAIIGALVVIFVIKKLTH